MKRTETIKYFSLLLLFSAVFAVWAEIFAEGKRTEVFFLDVGQGDAVYVRADKGMDMLIDGGEGRSVLNALSEAMPFSDREVDILVLTHPHKDHAGGLVEVAKRYGVKMFVEPCLDSGEPSYLELKKIISEKNIRTVCGRKGQKLCLGGTTCFDILLPAGEVEGRSEHDAMLAGILASGDLSVFLAGDMEENLERYVAYIYGSALESDILKVAHHGSDTSTSEAFLSAVGPAYAVISVGEENKFGHPRQEVIDRLERSGAVVIRTDQVGTVKVTAGRSGSFEISY